MLVSNDSADKRLSSSDNLINRLRSGSLNSNNKAKNAMSLFVPAAATRERDAERLNEKENHAKRLDEYENRNSAFNPFESSNSASLVPAALPAEPKAEDLIGEKDEAKLKLGLAHDSALEVLNKAVSRLGQEIDNIPIKALPSVISATSKVVEGIRREKLERERNNKDKEVHYHFYTPQQRTVSDYDVIDVTSNSSLNP